MLIDELSKAGLVVNNLVIDGEIHRCGTVSKPRSKNGWYVVFENGAAAVYGNWELGDQSFFWKGKGVTSEQMERIRARRKELKEKQQLERDMIADQCAMAYEHAAREGYSDYLKKKRIYPHGARFDGSTLIIPVQNADGKICSIQRIYGDGTKQFAKGGAIRGNYFPIFGRNVSKSERVVVCEGFATGAAIHESTNLPVIVAFNAHNLKEVCKNVPFTNLVIAADNDKSGVGEAAARDTGYPYVMPEVEGWDFSDMFLDGRDLKPYFREKKNKGEVVAHGIVQQIADWITETSVRPQPELSLAAALAFVGMVKGHYVVGATGLRTNLLVLSLAPTGSGKDHPQKCVDMLATALGLGNNMMGNPTSGAALLKGIERGGNKSLLMLDEIGRYLGNVMHKSSGGFQREILDYMIQLFSAANRTFRGKEYANPKTNPQIILENPHFCCLGSSVTERVKEACTSSEVLDGFLNRWIVFKSDLRPKYARSEILATPPAEILDSLQKMIPEGDQYGNKDEKVVRFSPEALDRLIQYQDFCHRKGEQLGYPMDALYTRNAEHAEKVALTVCDDDMVHLHDIDFGIRLIERSCDYITQLAKGLADNEHEADFVRVRELIEQHGTIDKSRLTVLTQRIQGGSRRRAEIINALLDANVIAEQTEKTRTRDKVVYKYTG